MKIQEIKDTICQEKLNEWAEQEKSIEVTSAKDHLNEIDLMLEEMEKEGGVLTEEVS